MKLFDLTIVAEIVNKEIAEMSSHKREVFEVATGLMTNLRFLSTGKWSIYRDRELTNEGRTHLSQVGKNVYYIGLQTLE